MENIFNIHITIASKDNYYCPGIPIRGLKQAKHKTTLD